MQLCSYPDIPPALATSSQAFKLACLRGREEVPVQLSRLVDAHQVIIREARTLARRATQLGDDGTNDLAVSEVLRTNELQTWFLSEHLVNVPLVRAEEPTVGTRAA
jgi:DNA-binding ferritin-like protein